MNITCSIFKLGKLNTLEHLHNLKARSDYCDSAVTSIANALQIMDHCDFWFATRGQYIKGKKQDCFVHNHIFCFKLRCASIVVLLCTATWWKSKDAVVHWVFFQFLAFRCWSLQNCNNLKRPFHYFTKSGPSPASFRLFSSFQKNITILQQINVKKC